MTWHISHLFHLVVKMVINKFGSPDFFFFLFCIGLPNLILKLHLYLGDYLELCMLLFHKRHYFVWLL